MNFTNFEKILSKDRLQRYLIASNYNTKSALTLYRNNLRISQEMFTIISCFEVALRNAIDSVLSKQLGPEWLKDSIKSGGIFDDIRFKETKCKINKAYVELCTNNMYSHSKLLASLDFGSWKYMFAKGQYKATGKCLLKIFPKKPKSTITFQYNNTYIFNELDKVNNLRNRIAHHEPICFTHKSTHIDTSYITNEYNKIITLFKWMGIDNKSLLYGLDHIFKLCNTMI
ncbi:MAG: Abi family protein [Paludibacteraceae bacterium]|nr:Abi family protein [Paludibacteraceae bacterium]